MVRLYCRCGYPLWIAARWTGDDIALVVRDGQFLPNRAQPLITHCPHCGAVLVVADLAVQITPIWLRPFPTERTGS